MAHAIRSSYWFVPGAMTLGALLLGVGVVFLDAEVGPDWLDAIPWYQSTRAGGAREVLSTIASSAITVAGVAFSITIVAISFAAGQYGPRLLTNFMGDRGNQITLGTFVATFVYCLAVLRTIRGGDENGFVPDIAVLIGLVLAICSIGVFIYFIHHVPRSIHINHVVAGIGRRLMRDVASRFPEFIGEGPEADTPPLPRHLEAFARPGSGPGPTAGAAPVPCERTGYIQAIDPEALMEAARRFDVVIRLHRQPGDYVHVGRDFAEVWPQARSSKAVLEALTRAYAVGDQRTPTQDLHFLADELVEVAARALSPGVSDPFTAMSCLDWLASALSEIARRRLPGSCRFDADGDLRVIAEALTFEAFVRRVFGQLRPYLASDRNAALHALETLDHIAASCSRNDQVRALQRELEMLATACEDQLGPGLIEQVREEVAELRARLGPRAYV